MLWGGEEREENVIIPNFCSSIGTEDITPHSANREIERGQTDGPIIHSNQCWYSYLWGLLWTCQESDAYLHMSLLDSTRQTHLLILQTVAPRQFFTSTLYPSAEYLGIHSSHWCCERRSWWSGRSILSFRVLRKWWGRLLEHYRCQGECVERCADICRFCRVLQHNVFFIFIQGQVNKAACTSGLVAFNWYCSWWLLPRQTLLSAWLQSTSSKGNLPWNKNSHYSWLLCSEWGFCWLGLWGNL